MNSVETKWGTARYGRQLSNEGYVTFYDFGIMQPRYVLQEISRTEQELDYDRVNNFREDDRIPEQYRQSLRHYTGSGYDRGHLAPSADLRSQYENSASFMLSNMSPQLPQFNRTVWNELERSIRGEAVSQHRCWCMSGPLWYPNHNIDCLTAESLRPVPIPNAYFKSSLFEAESGRISARHYVVDHTDGAEPRSVTLEELEWISGLQLWTLVESREKISG